MSFTAVCPGAYAPPALVEEPTADKWGYGLSSVATFIDNPNEHERNGIKYKSFRCVGNVQNWEDSCVTDDLLPKVPTDPNEDNVVVGCPFHLYAALSCKTTTLEAMTAGVAEVFNYGEQQALETQVWNRVLAQSSATILNVSSLPADAFSVVQAFAALETAFSNCYGARGVLHAYRGFAAFAFDNRQIELAGDHFESRLGTPIAFYGGSPNSSPAGVAAPAGYAWVYITTDITVRRFTPEILPTDTGLRLQYNPLTNEPFVVAERTYVPSIECCAFAVLVNLCDACTT